MTTFKKRTRPAALLKLDIRYKTLVTYQTFDCLIKVRLLNEILFLFFSRHAP
jgi:hypothetical protein